MQEFQKSQFISECLQNIASISELLWEKFICHAKLNFWLNFMLSYNFFFHFFLFKRIPAFNLCQIYYLQMQIAWNETTWNLKILSCISGKGRKSQWKSFCYKFSKQFQFGINFKHFKLSCLQPKLIKFMLDVMSGCF